MPILYPKVLKSSLVKLHLMIMTFNIHKNIQPLFYKRWYHNKSLVNKSFYFSKKAIFVIIIMVSVSNPLYLKKRKILNISCAH